MKAGADTEGAMQAVPLLKAVFCVDCETINNSPHDVCTVCGSPSLTNVFRMLGGSLRSQSTHSTADHLKTAKYNLELTIKVHEIPANELNRALESISRLAEVCGDLESLHINVEPVFDTRGVLQSGLTLTMRGGRPTGASGPPQRPFSDRDIRFGRGAVDNRS